MTFTYLGTLATDLDNVRFNIGDTVENSGPKPNSANFTDAELNGLITREGSWQRAVAGAFEALAGYYAPQVDIALGPRKEALSKAKEAYASLAEDWRSLHGSATSSVGSSAMIKVDGYSDDIAADDV
jgi:hypothetical protein